MRTISAKYPKGQEPPRTLADNLRLLRRIVSMGLDYAIQGRRIRKAFYVRQRARQKLYIDDPEWL